MIHYELGHYHLRAVCQLTGSLVPRALVFALPSTLIGLVSRYLLENHRDTFGEGAFGLDDSINSSQIWAALNGVLVFILSFRTSQALGRFWEGTTLTHQLRAEWFDACSSLFAFTQPALATKPQEVLDFRHTLVRLMSLMHGCALFQIKELGNEDFDVLDSNGLGDDCLEFIEHCKQKDINRVEVIMHWIQQLITASTTSGAIAVAPPIITRVYQELSRGMVNLHNAKKITDTPFPFPYAQIIVVLLMIHWLFTPIIVSVIVSSYLWTAIVTFVPVFGLWSINLVAGDLEQPFGDDSNDLPLWELQSEMNRGLLTLLDPRCHRVPELKSMATRRASELHDKVQKTNSVHKKTSIVRHSEDDAASALALGIIIERVCVSRDSVGVRLSGQDRQASNESSDEDAPISIPSDNLVVTNRSGTSLPRGSYNYMLDPDPARIGGTPKHSIAVGSLGSKGAFDSGQVPLTRALSGPGSIDERALYDTLPEPPDISASNSPRCQSLRSGRQGGGALCKSDIADVAVGCPETGITFGCLEPLPPALREVDEFPDEGGDVAPEGTPRRSAAEAAEDLDPLAVDAISAGALAYFHGDMQPRRTQPIPIIPIPGGTRIPIATPQDAANPNHPWFGRGCTAC